MLRKRDLKPGMKVQNCKSGRVGIVRGKGNRLVIASPWHVAVSVGTEQTYWAVENLQLYKPSSKFTEEQRKELLKDFDEEDLPFLETL